MTGTKCHRSSAGVYVNQRTMISLSGKTCEANSRRRSIAPESRSIRVGDADKEIRERCMSYAERQKEKK